MGEPIYEVRSIWVVVRYHDDGTRLKNMMALTDEEEAKTLCVHISTDDLVRGEDDYYYKVEPLPFMDIAEIIEEEEKAEN